MIFNKPNDVNFPTYGYDALDQAMSATMIQLWSSFAKAGVPSTATANPVNISALCSLALSVLLCRPPLPRAPVSPLLVCDRCRGIGVGSLDAQDPG